MRLSVLLAVVALVAGNPLPAADTSTLATTQDGIPTLSVQNVNAVIARFRAYHYSGRCLSVHLGERSLTPAENHAEARRLLTILTAEGLFPDIDYADKQRTFWTTLLHAKRAVILAIAAGGSVGCGRTHDLRRRCRPGHYGLAVRKISQHQLVVQ